MKLTYSGIKDTKAWDGVRLPEFDVEQACKNTETNPRWVHFGGGNIFRGFVARVNQTILEKGLAESGIIVAETFDYDIIDKIYAPFDNLTLLVRLNANGNMEKEVIAGVSKAVKVDGSEENFAKMAEIFENPSLQMISFTITEKGYALWKPDGELLDIIKKDIENGTEKPMHVMSIVCALLYKRYQAGKYALAVCSMDNCSHNGEKLKTSIVTLAKNWCEKGFVEQGFVDYLSDESVVSFPWSMIDKITPRPAKSVEEELAKIGVEDMAPIVTSRNTFIAPFVNAESPEYLVMENNFPNGRPRLEYGGVYLTDRDTVNQVETMKVTTCLNPLHTALAVYGCLLGYTRIYEEMRDEQLSSLVKKIGYEEGMKVVVDPKIIDPKKFIDEVIGERFPNPFVPDEPQRIATDTSQKVGIRFGETIKSYVKSDELDVKDLTFIPLAIAGWLRYLLGVDDNGEAFEISPDPLLEELTSKLATVKLGGEYNGELLEILKNTNIFGVDLVEVGLSDKIEDMFVQLIKGKDAVRNTLIATIN